MVSSPSGWICSCSLTGEQLWSEGHAGIGSPIQFPSFQKSWQNWSKKLNQVDYIFWLYCIDIPFIVAFILVDHCHISHCTQFLLYIYLLIHMCMCPIYCCFHRCFLWGFLKWGYPNSSIFWGTFHITHPAIGVYPAIRKRPNGTINLKNETHLNHYPYPIELYLDTVCFYSPYPHYSLIQPSLFSFFLFIYPFSSHKTNACAQALTRPT